jgi:monofunctional glycosyltransferase
MSQFRGPFDGDRRDTTRAPVTSTAHTRTGPVPPPPPTVRPPAATLSVKPKRRSALRRLFRACLWIAGLTGLATLGTLIAYRFVDPPTTPLILAQHVSGQQISQTWVPLHQISPDLMRAVIMSEDAGFCRHRGVDWRELSAVLENARDGAPRGGSTISMQLAKNLFLWTSKSYIRKALEIPLTLAMEVVLPKRRVLELYLNVAEWGPGIFGAEAAANYYFKKSASQLTEAEAALLAVALPNPIARDAADPSALQSRLAGNIAVRMQQIGSRSACVLGK